MPEIDVNEYSSHDGSIVDTLQSLVIAFVLAMTFRGFVTEGFVIPTGSMAPTLMGQHLLLHSDQTGVTYPIGVDQSNGRIDFERMKNRIVDPILGPGFPNSGPSRVNLRPRMGDRILVLKSLYPFSDPDRFDVVVFKNPTDPNGETANYIKRLIGLPNEHIWLADGDVFAKHIGDSEFIIQRKPEHVQRAVWQPIYDSDFIPIKPDRLMRPYHGPPWIGNSRHWETSGRSFKSKTSDQVVLLWDNARRSLDDWTPYNMIANQPNHFPVSDIRVRAGIVAEQPGLSSTLELQTRETLFQFIIESDRAILRMRSLRSPHDEFEVERSITLPDPGEVFNVEFWHVDQSMHMFINGKPVLEPLLYNWAPLKRLQQATGDLDNNDVDDLVERPPQVPKLRWIFEGSPVTLHRIRVGRDLHYRYDTLGRTHHSSQNEPRIFGKAFGTHPEENAAILGPDQFMMLGDNSQMSLDSRLWGSPHELVATQIDDSPFVVNRKLLLGKAWVVYFPSPYAAKEGGRRFIPDFGRLRFIR